MVPEGEAFFRALSRRLSTWLLLLLLMAAGMTAARADGVAQAKGLAWLQGHHAQDDASLQAALALLRKRNARQHKPYCAWQAITAR